MNLIKSILKTNTSRFIIISFVPVIISTVLVFLSDTSDILWLRMIWNYFLAVIPVYATLFAEHFSQAGKRLSEFIFMLLWLLFFPNSVYMITDYKYLSKFDFTLWDEYAHIGENLAPWLLVANLVISITLGLLAGMISLEIIHNLLNKRYSNKICWIIISVLSLISSFGVYIGRYARLNSWDIVKPVKIIQQTISVMMPFAPVFILLFTVLTLLLYGGYKYFLRTVKALKE